MGWNPSQAMGAVFGGYTGLTNAMSAQEQNSANAGLTHQGWNVASNEARIQRDWSEKMSNSAYQRATDDMTKAGINPMVAFQQGGASTPSGATGQVNAPARMENVGQQITSSAIDSARLMNDLKRTGSEVMLNDAVATKSLAEASTSGSSARQMEANTKAVNAQLKAIEKEAKAREKKAAYDDKFGEWDAIGTRVNRDAGSAAKIREAIQGGGFSAKQQGREKWKSQSERDVDERTRLRNEAEAIFKKP